jgi:hypothetical protein
MKYLILTSLIYSLSNAQEIKPLGRAPTAPSSSTEGTGPSLGGAMGGGGSSLYEPNRGNEFPQERMETPEIYESFEDPLEENSTTRPRNNEDQRNLIPGQNIPGIQSP